MQIKRMEDTVHGLDTKMKEKDLKNKNLQEKVCANKINPLRVFGFSKFKIFWKSWF